MLTETYLEPSQTSTMELFSLQLSHILKMHLYDSIELPLSSIFHTTHPFVKKTYNYENFGRKSLLFFRNLKLHNGLESSIKRSSHRRCSIGKGVLTNFTKFTGKHLCQSLSFKLSCRSQALGLQLC